MTFGHPRMALGLVVALTAQTVPAVGQPDMAPPPQADVEATDHSSEAIEDRLTFDERLMIQEALVFAGGYNTWIDGDFGPLTRQAIRTFQSIYDLEPTGIIGIEEAVILFQIRNSAHSDASFIFVNDPASQSSFQIPQSYIDTVRYNEINGTDYIQNQYPFLSLRTGIFYNSDLYSLQIIYNAFATSPDMQSTYQVFHNDWFVISGIQSGRSRYLRFHHVNGTIKSISINWASGAAQIMNPITMIITNSYLPTLRTNLTPSRSYPTIASILEARAVPLPVDPPAPPSDGGNAPQAGSLALVGTGSGFFINEDGYLMTAGHVIEGCQEVTLLPATGSAESMPVSPSETVHLVLEFLDDRNDLAILSSGGTSTRYVSFRSGSAVRLGEDIALAGFPLSFILSPELNITNGIISSLAGIASERQYLQITAPVQSGNSGGPLLDMSGNLIGIVVARLDHDATAALVGTVPENVNFAVKSQIAEAILVQAGVEYHERTSDEALPLADIAEAARSYTVSVGCWN